MLKRVKMRNMLVQKLFELRAKLLFSKKDDKLLQHVTISYNLLRKIAENYS